MILTLFITLSTLFFGIFNFNVPHPSQRFDPGGIPNFHQVDGYLLRGGQPTRDGFFYLRSLGVRVIVNLRSGGKKTDEEKKLVETLGMKFVSIPWKLWNPFTVPKDSDVNRFLQVIEKAHKENQKVFVHCKEGSDRTGLMIACYRISEYGWLPQRAWMEMKRYGFKWYWYWRFKGYLYNFNKKKVGSNTKRAIHNEELPEMFIVNPILSLIGIIPPG